MLSVFCGLALLGGCSGLAGGPKESINEIVIRNETRQVLQDIALRVPERHVIVSANFVLPLRDYSLGFRPVEYQQRYATLSWIQDGTHYSREIKTEVPSKINPDKAYRIVIRVLAGGEIRSVMERHSAWSYQQDLMTR